MHKTSLRIAVLLTMTGAIAACGGSDSSAPAPTPTPAPPPPAAALEDQFGTGFGTAYRVSANTDAKDPAAGDIVALSLTTDPVTL